MVEAKSLANTATVSLIGVFDAPSAAERAYNLLLELGYNHNEITVLMSHETGELFRAGSPVTASVNGAEIPNASAQVLGGAGAMSAVGAISGIVAAVGAALVIPGVGLVVAGPLAALGASVGAALGALYGIPIGAMTENKVADYETKIREGKVLLSIEPHSPEDREIIQRGWDEISNAAAKGGSQQ